MPYIGIQRQTDSTLFTTDNYSIANGAPVDFNTNLDYFSDPDTTITYNNTTSTFTFTQAGYYYVDWFVALQSAYSTSGPTFTLVVSTGTQTSLYQSTSSFKTESISGSAIVEASAGTTMKLQNDTGGVAILANNIIDTNGFGIVANISILRYVQNVTGVEVGVTGGTNVASGDIIPYNTQISNTSSPAISNNAGSFTINTSGIYLFDWKVSMAGIDGSATEINLELRQGTTTVVGRSVESVIHPGFITGTAIVSVTAGQSFALYNATVDAATPPAGVRIIFPNISLQATMRIVTLV